MEIERQRGISVATSVLAFYYRDKKINILDTPGHKDFAEDTFRTLTAVDSVIVVIDVAKGVEEQTEKLVEVCRMRNIPMIVFINKLDREGKDAFDLLDEVEQKLGLHVTPLSFPIGMGYDFQGIYNIYEKNINLFKGESKKKIEETISFDDLSNPQLEKLIGEQAVADLRDHLELVEGVYPPFDREAYLEGSLQPVFFGSALNNFGVRELLDCFVDIAPPPRPKKAEERVVNAEEPEMTGFVFKIHANMDPKHRDRLAFVKIVSGTFERNKPYRHVRLGKQLKFSSPNAFFAEKKAVIDESFPGDIVGLHDTGNFKIGDTLTEGEELHYRGIPSFSPEHFRYINNADPMKSKQLAKGIDQLMDEGVAQLFTLELNGRKVIGTVVATRKDPKMMGMKLLVVRDLDLTGRPTGGWHSPGFSQQFEAEPGGTYTIGFWVRNHSATFIARIGGVSAFDGEYELIVRTDEEFARVTEIAEAQLRQIPNAKIVMSKSEPDIGSIEFGDDGGFHLTAELEVRPQYDLPEVADVDDEGIEERAPLELENGLAGRGGGGHPRRPRRRHAGRNGAGRRHRGRVCFRGA